MMNKIYATVDDTVRARKRRNMWIGVAAGITVLALAGGVALMLNQKPVGPANPSPSVTTTAPTTPSPTPTVIGPDVASPDGPWQTARIHLMAGGVWSINGEYVARDRDEAWMTARMGTPDSRTESATCKRPDIGTVDMKNVVLRWGEFSVTIVNQPMPGPGGDFPAGSPLGWQLDSRLDQRPGASPDAKFENGIGVGSTRQELSATWPDGTGSGDTFSMMQGDISNLEATLADGRVVAMHSGIVCEGN